MTEVHRRVLRDDGPALLFEKPDPAGRVDARGAVVSSICSARCAGSRAASGIEPDGLSVVLATNWASCHPTPPEGSGDAIARLPPTAAALKTRDRAGSVRRRQETALLGEEVDLASADPDVLAGRTGAAGDPASVVTGPLDDALTAPPTSASTSRYRRATRSGRSPQAASRITARLGEAGARHTIAVVIGADPATIPSAVLPLPETLSELHFSGLLRGERARLVDRRTVPLRVPAEAEFVLEGFVSATETRRRLTATPPSITPPSRSPVMTLHGDHRGAAIRALHLAGRPPDCRRGSARGV